MRLTGSFGLWVGRRGWRIMCLCIAIHRSWDAQCLGFVVFDDPILDKRVCVVEWCLNRFVFSWCSLEVQTYRTFENFRNDRYWFYVLLYLSANVLMLTEIWFCGIIHGCCISLFCIWAVFDWDYLCCEHLEVLLFLKFLLTELTTWCFHEKKCMLFLRDSISFRK